MAEARPTPTSATRRVIDYYRFLGVPRDASPDQIVEAYLAKAQVPDPPTQERAERALAILSNPAKRREYDRALAAQATPRAPGPSRPGARNPAPPAARVIPVPWIAGLIAGLVLLALGWAITSTSGASPGAGATALGTIPSTGATGSVQLSLALVPDPPRPGPTTFTLQVQDPQGQPLPGAQVRWSMDMTNMSMGPQGGQMTDLGGGKYQARADFDMGGPWRIKIAVGKAGQSLGSGYFDLQIR